MALLKPKILLTFLFFICLFTISNISRTGYAACDESNGDFCFLPGEEPPNCNCTDTPWGRNCIQWSTSGVSCTRYGAPGTLFVYTQWLGCSISDPSPCGGGPACFLPGTKVQTPKGQVKIEDFKASDKVISVDPKSGALTENTVSSLHITSQDHYYIIKTASGKEIRATDEHPFYTGENPGSNKPFIQKVQATVNILYIYLQDGWQVVKSKVS